MGENDPEVFTNDYTYDIVVSASEDGGKKFEGEGKVEVYRGDYDLNAEVQDPVVSPGETVDLLLKTTDVIDRHNPVGNRKVQVEVGASRFYKQCIRLHPSKLIRCGDQLKRNRSPSNPCDQRRSPLLPGSLC